ncbi:CBS domain-containing protein, partial [Gilvimarinus sp. 1_MG-2023]|nr:CBS domain-containing protein [Gilvimarinus sp. 1_MG-2023]
MPTLAEVMTAFPLHIGENTRLTEAADLMAQHQCHHLPVMDGDEVIGLLGADDIKLAQQPGHNLDDSQELVVGDM